MVYNMGKSETFIWAHRGASGYITDNTLDGFKLAIEQKADGIESDVTLTKDNIPIFFHDYHIYYHGNKTRPKKLTLKEIKEIDLDDKNRKVPTVDEVFYIFKDIKNSKGKSVRFSLDIDSEQAGILLIEKSKQFNMEERIELTFDNYSRYKRYRAISKKIVLVDSAKMNLWKKFSRRIFYNNYDKLRKYKIKAINIKAEDANDEIIEDIRKNKFLIYVWDCHEADIITRFIKKGVDAIYTNYPDVAVRIREKIRNRL
ncbi:MAG: hypothetical protein GF364_03790 [Candidatus Lokiarchaeota archaeon]|nr:hypothetical protein [Candidatus Lokiarchaeota archaeon]